MLFSFVFILSVYIYDGVCSFCDSVVVARYEGMHLTRRDMHYLKPLELVCDFVSTDMIVLE